MKHKALRYIAILAILVLMSTLFALQNIATNQRQAAESMHFEDTLLSEQDWLRYGREMAHNDGLVGEPQREETALMTFGSYLTLTGQNPNDGQMPRDMLVFVYQVFGDVPILKGFSFAAGRTDIEGFKYAFNASTGMNFQGTALVKGKPGALDLSFIPADPGPDPSLTQEIPPTTIQELPEPENTTDAIVPLPQQPDTLIPLPTAAP